MTKDACRTGLISWQKRYNVYIAKELWGKSVKTCCSSWKTKCRQVYFFNYLAGKRISIIEDTPGITRDRIYVKRMEREEITSSIHGGIEAYSEDYITAMARQAHQPSYR